MTFEKLFEKMTETEREGAAIIVKNWMQEMRSGIRKWENFDLINGFLWGLYGAGFISIADKEDLYKILDQIAAGEE